MIFRRIILKDLLSYKGEQIFDFTSSGDKSLALVIGRNGYGKTSLLTAVKLLFLGTQTKSQRQVGFPPRNINRNEYVLGIPRGWSGILNRHAEGSEASITIEMGEADTTTLTATRTWRISGQAFVEDVRVAETNNRPLAGDAAEIRLTEMLPRELVPFFFFDGEEIQFLAEGADAARAEAMERLLSLSFVVGVEQQLGEIVKSWRREQLPEEKQKEIKSAEGALGVIDAEIAALRSEMERKQRDLQEAEEDKETQRRRMEAMRTSGAVEDTTQLEERIAELSGTLENEQAELAKALAADVPLLANPALVEAALKSLSEVVDYSLEAQASVAHTLIAVLPDRLFAEPPQPRDPLNDDQERFFREKLGRILAAFDVHDTELSPFLQAVELSRAKELLRRFTRHSGAMGTLRQDRARRLREISAKRAQLVKLEGELREAKTGGGERAREYKHLEEKFAGANRTAGGLQEKIEKTLETLEAKQAKRKETQKHLNELERQLHLAGKTSEQLRTAIASRETFVEYRKRNRAARREEIEKAVNRHFQRLMTGHRMIDRICIDDDFFMHFLDAEGQEFGQLTISHGMRQLAVTALLWALKEVSGRSLPIIVDTPLARIDKANQRNLLETYYPYAAEQVIILATDSEIDSDKFELLRDYVGVQFRLENPDGQSTHIVRTGTDRLATEYVDD
jgi:DNA sulfur modification protein DndD